MMHRQPLVLAGLLWTSPVLAEDTAMIGSGGDGSGRPIPAVGTGSLNPAAKGRITVTGATLTVNLSADRVGEPIAFAPSVYYGIDDKLAIGLTHDGGSTPLTPRPGVTLFPTTNPLMPSMTVLDGRAGGICVSGEDSGCPEVYSNVGADVFYALEDDTFSIAAHGGLDAFNLDPFALTLRGGVIGRYLIHDKISVVFDPRVRVGLTERDANKDAIDVSAWLWFKAMDGLDAYIQTGFAAPFDGFGDFVTVPIGLGANYRISNRMTAGLDFSFLNLLGSGGSADARAASMRTVWYY